MEKLHKGMKIQSTNNKSDDEIKQTEQETVNKKDTVNVESAENWYSCNVCDYRVKKEITLKKHINIKHSKNYKPEGMALKEVVFSYFWFPMRSFVLLLLN